MFYRELRHVVDFQENDSKRSGYLQAVLSCGHTQTKFVRATINTLPTYFKCEDCIALAVNKWSFLKTSTRPG